MQAPMLLLVDVEAPYDAALRRWSDAHSVEILSTHGEIPALAPESPVALCVVGLRGSDAQAYAKIRSLGKLLGACPVVVLARETGLELAIRILRLGVADVFEIPAPCDDLVARTVGHFADSGQASAHDELVGRSGAIRELRRGIDLAGQVDSTVLLQGETGTGKGLVARLIHARSRRAGAAFVHVDCAALSPSLIESELFGHERGAFTSAASLHRGRFEVADAGTIFLDEIGDLDGPLQSKLLRVLEDRSYERVGGTKTLTMGARVVTATHHNLLQLVREGSFRQDLYFRLNVLHFRIPPLRERLSDLPLLVRAGLGRLSTKLGVPMPRASDAFYAALADLAWPGNVRELMNVIERLLVHRRVEQLEVEDLDAILVGSGYRPEPANAAPVLRDASDEPALIRAALIDTGGNVTRASRRLQVARGTLRYKIRKYRLQHLIPSD